MEQRDNKKNKAKGVLLELIAVAGTFLALSECNKPIEKEIIPPMNIEPTSPEPIFTEPTVIKVYIYENEKGEMAPPKGKNSGRNMLDELKNLLKLSEEQEKKLLELVRNNEFEEAKKFLEALLLDHNIKIEYIVIKESERKPQFSRPYRIFESGDLPGTAMPPSRGQLQQYEARKNQLETGHKTGEWLKTIEGARRDKENNGGIDP